MPSPAARLSASVARLKTSARLMLRRVGLHGPEFRVSERRIATQPIGAVPVQDGRPMPPPYLITIVSGTPDTVWFSQGGERQAQAIEALARRHGIDLHDRAHVLDFGCGCGRVARWLEPVVLAGAGRFLGCDINPRLVRWCRVNLKGDYRLNRLSPPARIGDRSVDLLYALSVMTHLTQPRAQAWLDDFARLLRPGGLALVSFHDEDFRAEAVADQLARDGYAVSTTALEGSNYLAAYVTRATFRQMCAGRLEVVDILPSRAVEEVQAMAVLRRPFKHVQENRP